MRTPDCPPALPPVPNRDRWRSCAEWKPSRHRQRQRVRLRRIAAVLLTTVKTKEYTRVRDSEEHESASAWLKTCRSLRKTDATVEMRDDGARILSAIVGESNVETNRTQCDSAVRLDVIGLPWRQFQADDDVPAVQSS